MARIINNGGTVKIENSSIDDAKNIVANNGGSNGKLTATNSTFDHNYIGFSFLAANFVHLPLQVARLNVPVGKLLKLHIMGNKPYHISTYRLLMALRLEIVLK
nr:hypothetical protein [Bacteroidota bacterium]